MTEQSSYRRFIGIYAEDVTATATAVVLALAALLALPIGTVRVRLLLGLALVGTLLNLFELHSPKEYTRTFAVGWVLVGGALTIGLFVVGFVLAAPFVQEMYAGIAAFFFTSVGQYVVVTSTKPIWGEVEDEEEEAPGAKLPTQGPRGGQ